MYVISPNTHTHTHTKRRKCTESGWKIESNNRWLLTNSCILCWCDRHIWVKYFHIRFPFWCRHLLLVVSWAADQMHFSARVLLSYVLIKSLFFFVQAHHFLIQTPTNNWNDILLVSVEIFDENVHRLLCSVDLASIDWLISVCVSFINEQYCAVVVCQSSMMQEQFPMYSPLACTHLCHSLKV